MTPWSARDCVGWSSGRMASGSRDEVIDQLLAGARTEEEIAGPGGLLAQLTKRLVERAMEVELTDHVGYEPHCEPPGGAGNTRNGTSPKTLITEHGKVPIDAPETATAALSRRSSESASGGSWGSTTRSSRSTRRGLSTRDIEAHLEEMYGVKVGRELIIKVTDARHGRRPRVGQAAAGGHLPGDLPGRAGVEGSRGRHACSAAPVPRPGGHARGRARRAGDVVPGHRGRQVLDAGALTSSSSAASRTS